MSEAVVAEADADKTDVAEVAEAREGIGWGSRGWGGYGFGAYA